MIACDVCRRLFCFLRVVNVFIELIRDNFPSLYLIFWFGPLAMLWMFLALYIAGRLKQDRQWPTGYTRKLVHVIVFSSAALVQWWLGLPGVFVLGGVITLVTLYVILLGDGHLFYEAIAREKDAPHRSLHLLLPYAATLAGGMLCNMHFPAYIVATGYLVTGLGDAAGEPVGTRWGRHRYRVLSWRKVYAYRTVEGSIGVLVATLLALFIGYSMWPDPVWSTETFLKLFLVAVGCTIIEAVSPMVSTISFP